MIRWALRDLILKLLLLMGEEIDLRDWYEHELIRWAKAIGREVVVSHKPNYAGIRLGDRTPKPGPSRMFRYV